MHNAKSEKPPRVVLPPYTGFVLFGIAAGVSHAVSWRATGPGASESGVLHPERVGGASRGGSRCSPYNRALAGGWLLSTKASGRERSRHSCSSCWPCLHRPPQQPAHRVSVSCRAHWSGPGKQRRQSRYSYFLAPDKVSSAACTPNYTQCLFWQLVVVCCG